MWKEWRAAIIAGVITIAIALGATSYEVTYKAAQFDAKLQQTTEHVIEIKDLTKQMATMNENMVEIRTEMKYYRRDIDEIKKAQDDMSGRIDNISNPPSSRM